MNGMQAVIGFLQQAKKDPHIRVALKEMWVAGGDDLKPKIVRLAKKHGFEFSVAEFDAYQAKRAGKTADESQAPESVEQMRPGKAKVLQLVERCPRLPSLPAVALEVLELTSKPEINAKEIAETISNDPALASKILQTVNSSYYGVAQKISTIHHAITMLGLNVVKTLALGFSLMGHLKVGHGEQTFDMMSFWRRSIYCAVAARQVAKAAEIGQAEEAFLIGLIKEVGVLAMIEALGDDYIDLLIRADDLGEELVRRERRYYRLDHAEVVGMLAENWQLPAVLAEPMRWHEDPSAAEETCRKLARAVKVGALLADVFLTTTNSEALREYCQAARRGLKWEHSQSEQVLGQVGNDAQEMQRLFDIPGREQFDRDQMLQQANERLAEIALRPERALDVGVDVEAEAIEQTADAAVDDSDTDQQQIATADTTGSSAVAESVAPSPAGSSAPLPVTERPKRTVSAKPVEPCLDFQFKEGETLNQRYMVRQLLGHRAFGHTELDVYLVKDLLLGLPLALKVLQVDSQQGQTVLAEVRREFQMRQKIHDLSHVIGSTDCHVTKYGDRLLMLLPMEFADGGVLRKWLDDHVDAPAVRRRRGLELFAQVCMGVKALHAAGLVHLDLKPENVLLCGQDEQMVAKVTDLGISRNLKQTDDLKAGKRQQLWASPKYVSPELWQTADGLALSFTADIYSLGVMLYEIVDAAGQVPFDGDVETLARLHCQAPVPSPAGVDDAIARIVVRCLAKDPADRYPQVSDLLADVQQLLIGKVSGEPVSVESEGSVHVVDPVPWAGRSVPVVDSDQPKPFTNSLGMALVWIAPGSFTMGSPLQEPGHDDDEIQHSVKLTRGFYMATTPVTRAQWEKLMGSAREVCLFRGGARPVDSAKWEQAMSFCEQLSATDGRCYTLATEAQWEYACRAGTCDGFGGTGDLETMGWYAGNSGNKTHPVGKLQPNAWGLYDMHGNVWEWCLDAYGAYTEDAAVDPVGPAAGVARVLRGGSWRYDAVYCRSANRRRSHPYKDRHRGGFRVIVLPQGG